MCLSDWVADSFSPVSLDEPPEHTVDPCLGEHACVHIVRLSEVEDALEFARIFFSKSTSQGQNNLSIYDTYQDFQVLTLTVLWNFTSFFINLGLCSSEKQMFLSHRVKTL